MYLPNRVALSKKSTYKLQKIKQYTDVTANIASRIAIMLAMDSNDNISTMYVEDSSGQVLSKDVLFGDHIEAYEVLIRQYIHDNKIDMPVSSVISCLIETGLYKMGHVRSLEQLCNLKRESIKTSQNTPDAPNP